MDLVCLCWIQKKVCTVCMQVASFRSSGVNIFTRLGLERACTHESFELTLGYPISTAFLTKYLVAEQDTRAPMISRQKWTSCSQPIPELDLTS